MIRANPPWAATPPASWSAAPTMQRLAGLARAIEPAAGAALEIEVIAATEQPVERLDWERFEIYREICAVTPDAVDLTRAQTCGVPFLECHNRFSLAAHLGIVTEWRFDGAQLICRVRFARDAWPATVAQRYADGVLRAVSIGYTPLEAVREEPADGGAPIIRLTRWSLDELSSVPVPADLQAVQRRSAPAAALFPGAPRGAQS
jgi:hypothetical protein